MVADCPKKTKNYENYQEKAIQNKINEEAQKKAQQQKPAERNLQEVEERKDEVRVWRTGGA